MHVCLGMNLVAGTVLKPGEQPNPENHQYGTIALILAELLGRGARPNPEKPAEKIAASERDVWANYPVIFASVD